MTEVWERVREFQQSLFAELYATLRNTAIGIGFNPPEGKAWTQGMFMPGYRRPAAVQEYDWRTQKARMKLIGKRPDAAKRQADDAARADTQTRFRMAEEAQARGASKEEIRLILEA